MLKPAMLIALLIIIIQEEIEALNELANPEGKESKISFES